MGDTETFYAVTLSETDSVAQFELQNEDEVVLEKLIIRQIVLGAEAAEGEFNVVQVEKDDLKIPIAVLKAGETRILKPNLEFPNSSVTFKLIQGKGPVYMHGQHVVSEADVVDGQGLYEEEEEGDMDEEEQGVQTNGKDSKRK
ncbi:nucleoplasmin-like protein [Condylostylus longicornis]|uniref:nucleoplasmin-like protein n=1 Tax=Condylostylus longicornis TaxID=2530218 RepID=UPI00244DFA6A|nr:nucleoplasmin-like protein [Condylostylus longicornis]